MGAKARTAGANRGLVSVTDASSSKADRHGVDAPLAALVALAEELGRLLARRELAKVRDRRGYELPELMLGVSVMAVVWVLIARALGWPMH